MLERLTVADFTPLVGSTFRLVLPDAPPLPLTLDAANDLSVGVPPRGRRAPFSLWFRGPLAPVMPQRIYRLEHESFAPLDIFIVPRGPREGAMEYEAMFN